ncbi:tafazzin, phospholipid-lysophospholipid transacylase isoform X3 [Megalopta genalis]|uniref:tafazzin, phospholipid-lysophospholipid transacylase isoform X3 n=1 Tax=Megalopta genalis TaxID=115081 RepID=UPI001442F2F9|nr:tafazzin homolog isoform X1 [Megalopta genalis]
MLYDIKWIIPKLRNSSSLWNIASSITFAAVGIFSKIIIGRILYPPNEGHRKSVVGPCRPFKWLNKATVYNKHIMTRALDCRPKNVPLITISNHHSCFDDPGIWATLDLRHLLSRRKMRWSLAAHDICFTNTWHSYFFMLGRCIPVIRGGGIYQEAMDFCVEKLASGDWLHVFPEGKVNMLKEDMRLKWGVGRLIMESPVTPLVIPICHLGMDDVLPNEPPYWLRMGNRVTMNYGDPIDFSDLMEKLRASKASVLETRKAIIDRIQEELQRLKTVTEKLHEKL